MEVLSPTKYPPEYEPKVRIHILERNLFSVTADFLSSNKVLALPIQLGTHDEDRAGIQSYFPENALPTDWGFMYHQTKIDHDEMFLCSNWAGHRVKQDLSVGEGYPFAKEDPLETVDYSVGLRDKLLAHLDLWDASRKKLKFIQECAATDNARVRSS